MRKEINTRVLGNPVRIFVYGKGHTTVYVQVKEKGWRLAGHGTWDGASLDLPNQTLKFNNHLAAQLMQAGL